MSGKIIFKDFITRDFVRKNKDKMFVFGDNDAREGYGGQAKEMRDEANTIGIPVKKAPDNKSESFYTDKEFIVNVDGILDELFLLEDYLERGIDVIFPSAGIGTGLAQLDKKAPKTFEFLKNCMEYLINKFGMKRE